MSHYNVQPVFEVYANVQGRDLGAVVGRRAAGRRRGPAGPAARQHVRRSAGRSRA